ncbi:hypothetical protein KFL_006910010 [Klebsormidium nitens]|uniref:Glutamate-rich WD repeat-containing protein 1 n=1 Tax=Klebsormidium nitens TaxID=105231 RepID=A0A1Y1IQD4_KLENI|nr:hypothetical protein KFL_006910010 [Klebsormidium nitens]|eukprot:GAQ90837.1 hypothetical protein KFL_006910010 [Klebsormidium nitens]
MPRNPQKKGKKKRAAPGDGGASSSGAAAAGDVDMEGGAAPSGAAPAERPKVWRAGVDDMAGDEELQFDPTAYDCLHALALEWPCLSFDVVRDSLGEQRSAFPHTLYGVAGTQAGSAGGNSLAVMKLGNLTRMRRPRGGDDEDDEDEGSSSDEEEAGGAAAPVLQVRMVAHHGGVNRVRAMPQQPHIAATWGETGHVQVWDVSPQLRELAALPATAATAASPVVRQAPLHVFSGHATEGFAMDWSPVTPARLATGDCAGQIHVWEPREGGGWAVGGAPFRGHSSSVEDLQWSPGEAGVFASASCDKRIAVWDTRQPDRPALSVPAHAADVNVLSWNRLASCMLASGADDGTFRIWDLRAFQEDAFVAHFKYHGAPITSLEWSAHDSSALAVAAADNQLTLWDLSLEADAEEERHWAAAQAQPQAEAPPDLPAQLLFVHQGQHDLKELHWHPQVPGLLVSTAADGFNVFKASNL